jgi:hypothetical protein
LTWIEFFAAVTQPPPLPILDPISNPFLGLE